MTGTAIRSATIQPWPSAGGVAADDHNEIHVASDSVLHSDHSTEIVQNIAIVAAADCSVSRHGSARSVRRLLRPRRHSYSALTTTSAASSVQNSTSFQARRKLPWIQKVWYECSAQVTPNTTSVDRISAMLSPRFLSAKYAG